ncbi:uncharacterized protein LOC115742244 [Rhodamnia argentea]|uniref:Uncharacterized protein LOC115742244 n=1 Tax=Rhodamnia argentea TaxID=178133 RepID=A0ABM3GTF5_9MYRT|nr:uncharacterized protein LOC115742244 [Rhodamnia argentea]
MERLRSNSPWQCDMGQLDPPGSGRDSFEWEESDILWSSDLDTTSSPPATPTSTPNRHPFSRFGLSAALADPPLVRKKPAINPTLSAVSAARAIPEAAHSPSPDRGGSSGSGPGRVRMSAPVDVPTWPKWVNGGGPGPNWEQHKDVDDAEDDHGPEKEMVAPHEMAAMSQATVAGSVFVGAGRTLKGRDLSRVRSAVFRRTGFLD